MLVEYQESSIEFRNLCITYIGSSRQIASQFLPKKISLLPGIMEGRYDDSGCDWEQTCALLKNLLYGTTIGIFASAE
jgi:hypothetical protein